MDVEVDDSRSNVAIADKAEREIDLDLKTELEGSSCTYEDVIDAMGSFGKFQIIQLILCAFGFFPSAIMSLGFVFIGYTPSHVCNTINETEVLSRYALLNDSTAAISYGSCEVTVSSNQSGIPRNVDSFSCPDGRNFSGGKHLTLVSQWDLVCESMGMAELSQTLFIAGQIVGAFFVVPVADRFGRKWVMSVSGVICAFIEFSIAFSPNIYTVWALLFFDGIVFVGFNSNFYILGVEYLRPRHRTVFGVISLMFWTASVLYVDLVGYIFQEYGWRYFQATGGISVALLFLYPFFLYESPRWLASKNRTEEALVILKKACQQNGFDFIPVKNKLLEYVKTIHPKSQSLLHDQNVTSGESGNGIADDKVVHYTAIDLMRHKYTMVLLCMTWYIWITHNLTYYGIYMTSTSLSGNKFINFCILTLVEIPSNLAIFYLFERANRLFVMRLFLLVSTVCLLASSLVPYFSGHSPSGATMTTVLFIFGKFAITASFNALYIYTPEIFPTVVRSSAFGASKCVARVGSLLAPYFRPLYDRVQWAPGVIFSVLCVIALFMVPFLPETKGKILPTSIKEMKQYQRKRKDSAKDIDNTFGTKTTETKT